MGACKEALSLRGPPYITTATEAESYEVTLRGFCTIRFGVAKPGPPLMFGRFGERGVVVSPKPVASLVRTCTWLSPEVPT